MRVLQTSYELLLRHKTVTQRQVYYLHATFFRNQEEAMRAIARACELVGAPRHGLGILAASRGWMAGLAAVAADTEALTDAVEDISGVAAASTAAASGTPPRPRALEQHAVSIPATCVYADLPLENVGARAILVVEKECIFRRLVEDRVWEVLPCIVVTGCGFPDVATRAAVWQMHTHFRLPVYGLSDHNPFGMAIMACYRNGSASTPEANRFRVPLRWLGLRHDDIAAFSLPAHCCQPFTAADWAKARSLAKDAAVLADADWTAEAEWFAEEGVKMELEGILARGVGFLTDTYLRDKLAARDFI